MEHHVAAKCCNQASSLGHKWAEEANNLILHVHILHVVYKCMGDTLIQITMNLINPGTSTEKVNE